MTVMGAQLGTAGYAAPEQLTDARGAGVPADVFSLGTILYELVCGRPAFYQKDNNFAAYRATLEGKYAKVDDVVPDCPMHVASAITRALEYDAVALPELQRVRARALRRAAERATARGSGEDPIRAHRDAVEPREERAGARRASGEVDRPAEREGSEDRPTALIWIMGIAVAVLVLGLMALVVAAWLWMRLGA
jgi:serine/threonine protein kinase